MTIQIQPELYQIRSFMVCSYLIIDGPKIHLVDGGFLGGVKEIAACLANIGLSWKNISTILLTHGHVDHTFNLAQIQKRSGAKLFAHKEDSQHIAARYPYRGISRFCGLLEAIAKISFGYQRPHVDRWIHDGEILDLAAGIQVLHTPGHTKGHCAYHWLERNLIFTGDLFATGRKRTFLPPAILNTCPGSFPRSIKRIAALNADGLLSNHCDRANAATQKQRFLKHIARRT